MEEVWRGDIWDDGVCLGNFSMMGLYSPGDGSTPAGTREWELMILLVVLLPLLNGLHLNPWVLCLLSLDSLPVGFQSHCWGSGGLPVRGDICSHTDNYVTSALQTKLLQSPVLGFTYCCFSLLAVKINSFLFSKHPKLSKGPLVCKQTKPLSYRQLNIIG